MLFSLYLSFTNYDVLHAAVRGRVGGLAQLRADVHHRPVLLARGRVTLTFALIAVPLKLAAALGVALLLNRERSAASACSAACSTCRRCSAAAWRWPSSGSACSTATARSTRFLALFGIEGKPWVNDPRLGAGDADAAGDLAVRRADGDLPGRPQAGADRAVRGGLGRRRRRGGASSATSPCRCSRRSSSSTWCWRRSTASRASPSAFVLSNGTGGPVDSTLMYTLNLYIKGFTELRDGLRLGDGLGVPGRDRPDHRRAVHAPAGSGCTTPTTEETT